MAVGVAFFAATVLRLSPFAFTLGYLTFGTGIVLQVRRFNRNPWLTVLVVILVGILVYGAIVLMGPPDLSESFRKAYEDH